MAQEEIYGYPIPLEFDEIKRMSYRDEQRWLMSIENGTAHLEEKNLSPENLEKLGQIGILAEDNMFKQCEYMVITAACLACRAAIRGGMNAYEAYQLSDVYYQKTAKCASVQELLRIYLDITDTFSREVAQRRQRREPWDYMERCRDYVARNRTEKFTVADLAKELGISASYLSRKFKEAEGMTIQQYILDQKLIAAANIIQYSDAKICDVSDYLCFNSPSHMGAMFKKKYGVTPLEWRKEHKVADFDRHYTSRSRAKEVLRLREKGIGKKKSDR